MSCWRALEKHFVIQNRTSSSNRAKRIVFPCVRYGGNNKHITAALRLSSVPPLKRKRGSSHLLCLFFLFWSDNPQRDWQPSRKATKYTSQDRVAAESPKEILDLYTFIFVSSTLFTEYWKHVRFVRNYRLDVVGRSVTANPSAPLVQ